MFGLIPDILFHEESGIPLRLKTLIHTVFASSGSGMLLEELGRKAKEYVSCLEVSEIAITVRTVANCQAGQTIVHVC